jgi:multiple sugar transport system permease protein
LSTKWSLGIRYSVMILISIVILMPIVWMTLSSFRTNAEIFHYTTLSWHLLIPVNWTLQNYQDLFLDESKPFARYIWNTLTVSIIVTALGLLVNSLAAFAFAKMHFPLKRWLLMILMSSLVIPYEVIMIPQYLIVRDLGWINSYKALIAPQIVWVFGIFLLVQFFSELPRAILEAARIDGASWFRIYRLIVLPSAVPALITLGLITFLNQWDSFLWPIIVINDQERQMIQVVISTFSSLKGISWGKILAATSVSSLPIVVLFLFLQKYYVQGITLTGVKG